VLLKHLNYPREIHKRAAQAIHLVDHNAVHRAAFDVVHKPLKRGPVDCATAESAVIVLLGDNCPSLMFLAFDVRLCRLALGVKRIEIHVEIFSRGFASVYRATDDRRVVALVCVFFSSAHARLPPPLEILKNR